MKKTTILATTGAVVLVAGLLIPSSVMADDSGNTFMQRVAERVGVSSTELETAMVEVREENREERETAIESAVENGDLTADQYALLQAMHDARDEMKEDHQPGDGPVKDGMIDKLNESGVEVTSEDLDELREVMTEIGLAPQGPQGGRGMGMHR
jgi:anti-sigma28 factor (negative regulator of flagellin synthesis)